jgi:2,4-dienoyl-CoA reductase-like NADH-dependent reductase (Old Yellow Enzyme family)
MARLFEKTRIAKLEPANRFVRSATWEGLAREDGACTRELVDLMVKLAAGNVGLIITGHAFVSPEGQATRRQLGIHRDGLIDGLKEMTAAVHQTDGVIIMQLAHGGLASDPELTGTTPMGPSNGQDLLGTTGREMSAGDIQQTVQAFGQAARRAGEAGFDGVQIHAAHGYLLSQFLSPAFNRRQDDYGGTLENRVRFLMEVLAGIRRTAGDDYPVLAKINSNDFLKDGLTCQDALRAATMLDEAGIDAVEVSGGTFISGNYVPFRRKITFERDQAYNRRTAKKMKARIRAPVMLVGGIRSYLLAERLLDEEYTDYISMSRSYIREPGLIERWRSGDLRKATCISCNGCLGAANSGRGMYCVQDAKTDND